LHRLLAFFFEYSDGVVVEILCNSVLFCRISQTFWLISPSMARQRLGFNTATRHFIRHPDVKTFSLHDDVCEGNAKKKAWLEGRLHQGGKGSMKYEAIPWLKQFRVKYAYEND
jgi:hypothetical protein